MHTQNFAVVFKEDPTDQVIVATAPLLPGVVVQAESTEEAEKRITEAISFAIANKAKRGAKLPLGDEVVREVQIKQKI